MNSKYKVILSLILALTMVMGGVASAASMAFYDVTEDIVYNSDMNDAEIDKLIEAVANGNEIAKFAGEKLVNYEAYRQAIAAVIMPLIDEGKTAEEIALAVAEARPGIIEELDPVEGPEVPVEELKVVEVSAINKTQVEVVFNKEVKEVKPANFKVTDKDGNVLFVNKAELSAGKTVATLTFFNDFADKGVYTVETSNVADVDGNVIAASTDQFGYQAAEVAKVEFTSTTIAPSKNVKDILKVTDTLGRDVTNEVEIKYESSNETVVTPTGSTTAGNAIVVAKVGDVKTAPTTITVKAKEATSFVGFNIFGATNPANDTDAFGKLKAEDKKTYVSLGSSATDNKIALYYNDQYGEGLPSVLKDAKITNLTPSVAIVEDNGTNLVVKPISTGTAYVKLEVNKVETTIQIEVKKASVETVMELDKSDVSVVTNPALKETVKVTFKDQYDGKMNATTASDLKAVAKDDTIAKATAKNGNAVEIEGLKEGSTTVEVSYKVDATTTLKKTINVTVTKAGDLASYKAEVATTELDKTPGSTNAAKGAVDTVEVELYSTDSNGNKINKEDFSDADKKLVVVDKDGKEITTGDKVVDINVDNKTVEAKKVGTGYVQVKVGSLVIDTLEFTVVDTASTAAKVEFDKLAIVLGEVPSNVTGITGNTDTALKTPLQNIVTLKDQYGNEIVKTGLTFKTSVTNVIGFKSDLTELTAKNASATIVVTEAKDGAGKNLLKDPVIVQLSAKDTTAPVVTGVTEGQVGNTTTGITPIFADTDIKTATLTKDNGVAAPHTTSTKINDAGVYVLTVTDNAGNVTEVNFTIETTVSDLNLSSLVTAPVKEVAPDTTAIDETQYTGTIEWFAADGKTAHTGNFEAGTVYVAKVTLTAKAGFTFEGVTEDQFTHTGASSISNPADSGVVTITFNATGA